MHYPNTALQYSYVALAMLPSASGSVARSRHTKHKHTSLRFTNKRDIILTQEVEGQSHPIRAEPPPIGAEQGIYAKIVEYNLKNSEQWALLRQ